MKKIEFLCFALIAVLVSMIIVLECIGEVAGPFRDDDWAESPIYAMAESLTGEAKYMSDGQFDCEDWALLWIMDIHINKGISLKDTSILAVKDADNEKGHALGLSIIQMEKFQAFIIFDPQSALYVLFNDFDDMDAALERLYNSTIGHDHGELSMHIIDTGIMYEVVFHSNRYEEENNGSKKTQDGIK